MFGFFCLRKSGLRVCSIWKPDLVLDEQENVLTRRLHVEKNVLGLTSGVSSFDFWVDRLQFATCIIDRHLPVDSLLFCIHAT